MGREVQLDGKGEKPDVRLPAMQSGGEVDVGLEHGAVPPHGHLQAAALPAGPEGGRQRLEIAGRHRQLGLEGHRAYDVEQVVLCEQPCERHRVGRRAEHREHPDAVRELAVGGGMPRAPVDLHVSCRIDAVEQPLRSRALRGDGEMCRARHDVDVGGRVRHRIALEVYVRVHDPGDRSDGEGGRREVGRELRQVHVCIALQRAPGAFPVRPGRWVRTRNRQRRRPELDRTNIGDRGGGLAGHVSTVERRLDVGFRVLPPRERTLREIQNDVPLGAIRPKERIDIHLDATARGLLRAEKARDAPDVQAATEGPHVERTGRSPQCRAERRAQPDELCVVDAGLPTRDAHEGGPGLGALPLPLQCDRDVAQRQAMAHVDVGSGMDLSVLTQERDLYGRAGERPVGLRADARESERTGLEPAAVKVSVDPRRGELAFRVGDQSGLAQQRAADLHVTRRRLDLRVEPIRTRDRTSPLRARWHVRAPRHRGGGFHRGALRSTCRRTPARTSLPSERDAA